MPGKVKDKTGLVYGRLTVLKLDRIQNRASYWLCECICNKKLIVRSDSLVSGNTQSCGCLFKDSHTKHGMYGTPEYNAYYSMLDRCCNKDNENYHNYGGRGIKVCKRWLGAEGFNNFLKDMGEKPEPKKYYQIDREYNNKGYTPDNCRWTTAKNNSNNTRKNCVIEFKGVSKTLAEWAEYLDMPWSTLNSRLERGWSTKRALTEFVVPNPGRSRKLR